MPNNYKKYVVGLETDDVLVYQRTSRKFYQKSVNIKVVVFTTGYICLDYQ
jgi:hypothetical protein